MNYRAKLIIKESELEKLRDEKNLAVKEMKYEKASNLRDLEMQKESEIEEMVKNLQERFDEIPLTKHNYDELEELSKTLYWYNDYQNPLLKEKIKSAIKNLKAEKEEALLAQNFNLRAKFNEEIKYLKEQLDK